MTTLNVQSRTGNSNNKRLRKEGHVPAVIFGKHLDASIPIQIGMPEALKLVRGSAVGSQLDLKLGKEKYGTMLKDIQLDPVTYKPLHFDFQVLASGEKVNTHVHVKFLNKDQVATGGIVQELVTDIKFECLPKYLVDHIDIDLAGLEIGDVIKVSDLDISKDKNYNVLMEPDTDIVVVAHARVEAEPEPGEEGEEAAPAPQMVEPELVGKKKDEE